MKLIEWTTHHIKFKDCMKKQIVEMKVADPLIHVKEKSRDIEYLIFEELKDALGHVDEKKQIIVTLNTKENFEELVASWDTLRAHKQLTLMFVHPVQNEQWSVHPSTHHGITEEKHLKDSLLTLFSNVARV